MDVEIVSQLECTHCHETKPLTDFYTNVGSGGRIIPHRQCKACEWEILKARRAAKRPPKPEPVVRTEKPCSVCKVVKPLSEFGKDKHMKDGLLCACKACRWAYDKQKRATDPKRNEQLRETYQRNKAKIYASKTESQKRMRKEQPAKARAKDVKHYIARRAAKASSVGTFTFEEFVALCARYDNRCLRCGLHRPLTADHIIPLSWRGPNTIDNLQPLCRNCNASKNNRHIDYRPETPPELRGIELSVRISSE
jgi:5-methylcytosine-specific restriction endonuclease McrA